MKFLDTTASLGLYKIERQSYFNENIINVFKTLSKSQQWIFLENLEKFFGLKLIDTSIEFSETVLDSGLIYLDGKEIYKCLSSLASYSLLQFYLNQVTEQLQPVFSKVRALIAFNTCL